MAGYYDEIAKCQDAQRRFLVAEIYRRCDLRTTTYHFNAGEMWDKTRFIREKNKNTIIEALPGEVEETPSK